MQSNERGAQGGRQPPVGWPAFRRARRLGQHQCQKSARRDGQDFHEASPFEVGRQTEHEDGAHSARRTTQCDRASKFSGGQAVELNGGWRGRRARSGARSSWLDCVGSLALGLLALSLVSESGPFNDGTHFKRQLKPGAILFAAGSLIIGDSAIEIQEVEDPQQQQQQPQLQLHNRPSIILGTTSEQQSSDGLNQAAHQVYHQNDNSPAQVEPQSEEPNQKLPAAGGNNVNRLPGGPLPPLSKPQPTSETDDITDGDSKSRGSHDFVLGDSPNGPKDTLKDVIPARLTQSEDDHERNSDKKTITGKVVDFELQPAGGHNKAKIKKKKKMKKKKKKFESSEQFEKWDKKKKEEKKAMEGAEKKGMKKKKEEGKQKKKKWGLDVHGQKKKGSFKKKKWGQKVKKGKGVKKGKKGKKFLKDKGHKNTGFKTVYHKEEWGKSAKWHDIKREKKWDEKSKKWKKQWKKEKGKKYKGDHMKKFEKKKKEGKKYKKDKEEKFKKFKKEKFEKGKKKKLEEHKKKKEGGMKKEEEMKKKKKKKP